MAEDEKKIKVSSPSAIEKAMKNKWMMIAGGSIGVIILFSSLIGGSQRTFVEAEPEFIDVTPGEIKDVKGIELQAALDQQRKALRKLSEQSESMRNAQEATRQEISELRSVNSGLKAELDKIKQDQPTVLKKRVTSSKNEKKDFKLPPLAVGKPSGSEVGLIPAPPTRNNRFSANSINRRVTPNTRSRTGEVAGKSNVRRPVIFKAIAEKEELLPETRLKKNPYAGYLPTGSFADMALLTGLDAGTAEFARENPQPILMRIQTDAQLPGEKHNKYTLKSCFAMGVGVGNLSSERVEIRLTRLSCMDSSKGLLISTAISGYAVDSDGIQGLRGVVIRRSGALLAKAMLAGFAQGASAISASSSTNLVTNGLGGTTSSVSPSELPKIAALGGMGEAAEILAKQYIKEAQSMFPIIQLPSGRKGTVVFEGKKLDWKPYQGKYIEEIQIENG